MNSINISKANDILKTYMSNKNAILTDNLKLDCSLIPDNQIRTTCRTDDDVNRVINNITEYIDRDNGFTRSILNEHNCPYCSVYEECTRCPMAVANNQCNGSDSTFQYVLSEVNNAKEVRPKAAEKLRVELLALAVWLRHELNTIMGEDNG